MISRLSIIADLLLWSSRDPSSSIYADWSVDDFHSTCMR